MEKKYYDLISSLIKNHKKYATYSSILEELINHVYEQARTVINTVDDEKVIEEYLNKIIASAFITVPRKMNYNTKNRQNYSDAIISQSPKMETTETFEEQVLEEDVSEDFDNKEIDEEFFDLEANTSENSGLTSLVQEETDDNELLKEEIEDFDKSLIDKMINGISPEQTSVNIDEEKESELYDSLEDLDTSIENSSAETETIIKTDVDVDVETEINNEEDFIEDEVITLDFDAQDEILETDIDEIIIQEEIDEEILETEIATEEIATENNEIIVEEDLSNADEIEPEAQQDEVDEFIIDLDNTNTNLDINIDNNEDIEETLIDSEETLSENTLESGDLLHPEVLDNEIDISLDLQEVDNETLIATDIEDNLSEVEPLELNNYTTEEPIETKNVKSCYSFFNFAPINREIDAEEIITKLHKLADKDPDKNILEIVKLKYNDKLSIDEISNKTGLIIDDVINILNEVVNIIKD